MFVFFHSVGGISSSQLTKSIIFSEGWLNHQPVYKIVVNSGMSVLVLQWKLSNMANQMGFRVEMCWWNLDASRGLKRFEKNMVQSIWNQLLWSNYDILWLWLYDCCYGHDSYLYPLNLESQSCLYEIFLLWTGWLIYTNLSRHIHSWTWNGGLKSTYQVYLEGKQRFRLSCNVSGSLWLGGWGFREGAALRWAKTPWSCSKPDATINHPRFLFIVDKV